MGICFSADRAPPRRVAVAVAVYACASLRRPVSIMLAWPPHRGAIRGLGHEPRQRNIFYELLPERPPPPSPAALPIVAM